MKRLYEALINRLNHVHKFELQGRINVWGDCNQRPKAIITTYMCPCGKTKTIKVKA